MKKITTLMAVIALPVLSACTHNTGTTISINTPPPSQPNAETIIEESSPSATALAQQAYTLSEVAEHKSRDDCWLILSGKVYDVTQWIPRHPGGEAILQGCGKDATEFFETRPMGSKTPHSQRARDLAKNYEIGVLAQ